MRTLIRGWRRKLGIVALMLALVAMGGWGLSLAGVETVELIPEINGMVFMNDGHAIGCYGFGAVTTTTETHIENGQPVERHGVDIELTSLFTVPYWALVIPLSLLAGYLLWFQPRSAGPAGPSDNQQLSPRLAI